MTADSVPHVSFLFVVLALLTVGSLDALGGLARNAESE
jgi:hypothetical protein